MPLPKKSAIPPAKGKVATKRAAAARKRATKPPTDAATVRSKKVAAEYAAGTRTIPEEAYDDLPVGATPLDILVMAMRRAYLLGGSIAAAPFAEKAAPYMHGKISSIELKNPVGAGGEGGGKPVPFQVVFVDPKDNPNDD